MKQRIKLWILQMEGWKITEAGRFHKKEVGTIWGPPLIHKIELAWDYEFRTFKDYFKTKLFWLVFSMILGALFFFFDDNSTIIKNGISWFSTAGAVCFLFPVGYTLYSLGYMLYYWIKKLLNRKK